MIDHSRIIFNGNGYSDEWVAEAARRGLPNLRSMVEAIPALTAEKSVALFEKFGIFTRAELESRAEVMYETYAKTINIEARTMLHMAGKHYIPAVISYVTELAGSVNAVHQACPTADVSAQEELLQRCSELLGQARQARAELEAVTARTNALEDVPAMANAFHNDVVPAMKALRKPIDQLELLVDKDVWPVPTYGDLMFEV